MEWDGNFESYSRLEERGILNPKDRAPEIGPLMYIMDCYFEMSTCRSGLTASPIPFTAILEFAKVYNIDDVEELIYYVRRLDSVYLKRAESKKNG